MLPSAHFFSGAIIFAVFADSNLIPRSLLYLLGIIFFALVVDADMVLWRKHRSRPTHTPLFWLVVCGILTLAFPFLWFTIPVVFSHLLLDSIDWGVMLWWPVSTDLEGPMILAREVEGKNLSVLGYVRVYLHSKAMISSEIIIGAAGMISLAFSI